MAPSSHSDQGTILRLYTLGETSLIVVWLTERHGILRTAAKGAQKINSPFRGHLDLFFNSELQWSPAKSGDLHQLTSTSVLNPRLGLRKKYLNLKLLSYFSRLILATVEPQHPSPEFYDLLQRASGYLESQNASRKAMSHFEREMLRLHGLANNGMPPHHTLKNQFGKIPEQREKLWNSLPER